MDTQEIEWAKEARIVKKSRDIERIPFPESLVRRVELAKVNTETQLEILASVAPGPKLAKQTTRTHMLHAKMGSVYVPVSEHFSQSSINLHTRVLPAWGMMVYKCDGIDN